MLGEVLLSALNKCDIYIAEDCVQCVNPRKAQLKLESYLRSRQAHQEFSDQLEAYFGDPLAGDNRFELFMGSFTEIRRLNSHYQTGELESDLVLSEENAAPVATSAYSLSRLGGDSLFKLLLRICGVQGRLLVLLLTKIGNLCSEMPSTDACTAVSTALPRSGSLLVSMSPHQVYIMEIFNLIRWCDHIYNPEEIISIMLDTVSMFPRFLQTEIICALPLLVVKDEITGSAGADFSIHDQVLNKLLDLIDDSPELLPPVLSSISNLCVYVPADSPTMMEAVSRIGRRLSIAEPGQLPVIAKFLIEHTDPSNAALVKEMFCQLVSAVEDFLQGVIKTEKHQLLEQVGMVEMTQLDENAHKESKSALSLILDVVKGALQAKSMMFTHYVQYLSLFGVKGVNEGGSSEMSQLPPPEKRLHLRVIDLWIIYTLFGNVKMRPKLLTAVVNIVSNEGVVSEEVLASSIRHCGSMLEPVFSSVVALAQMCVSLNRVVSVAAAKLVRLFGALLYGNLYFEFKSVAARQELIVSVIMHVNTQQSTQLECQTALNILENISFLEFTDGLPRIVKSNGRSSNSTIEIIENSGRLSSPLRIFSPFLKTLLEDIHRYTLAQIRGIFDVIFRCCTTLQMFSVHHSPRSSDKPFPAANEAVVRIVINSADDIFIYLKKLFSSSDNRKSRAAVIGYVSYMTQLLHLCWHCEDINSDVIVVHGVKLVFECNQEGLGCPAGDISQNNILLRTLLYILSAADCESDKKRWLLEEFSLSLATFLKKAKKSTNAHPAGHGPCTQSLCAAYFAGVCNLIETGFQDLLAINAPEADSSLEKIQRCGITASVQHGYLHTDRHASSTQAAAQQFSQRLVYNSNSPTRRSGRTQDDTVSVRLLYQAVVTVDSRAKQNGSVNQLQRSRASLLSVFKSLDNCNEQMHLYTTLREQLGESVGDLIVLLQAGLELPTEDFVQCLEDYEPKTTIAICLSFQYAIFWLASLIDCVASSVTVGQVRSASLSMLPIPATVSASDDKVLQLLVDRLNLLASFEVELVSLVQRIPDFFDFLGLKEHVGGTVDAGMPKKANPSKSKKAATKGKTVDDSLTLTQLLMTNTQQPCNDDDECDVGIVNRPKMVLWERIVTVLNMKRSKMSTNIAALLLPGLPTNLVRHPLDGFDSVSTDKACAVTELNVENLIRILLLMNDQVNSMRNPGKQVDANVTAVERGSVTVQKAGSLREPASAFVECVNTWYHQRVFAAFHNILMNVSLLTHKHKQAERLSSEFTVHVNDEDDDLCAEDLKRKDFQTGALIASMVIPLVSAVLSSKVSLKRVCR
jgi:hypothetical protein